MSAKELQERMFKIQELCESLSTDLEECGAPDFDSITAEIYDAEIQWGNGHYSSSIETLGDVKSTIDTELENVGDAEAREGILEWIGNMPSRCFKDFA